MEAVMFIAYSHKNGTDYARVVESEWKNGTSRQRIVHNLGRVLDKKKGIYKNRKQGVFEYCMETDSFSPLEEEYAIVNEPLTKKEKKIVNFGDAYFLDAFLENEGLKEAIKAIPCANQDSLMAMVLFYTLCSMSNCHAKDWLDSSYARYLFPKADLASQRISELLVQIGQEDAWRAFFDKYIQYLDKIGLDYRKIIIDSTGLPNSIHFYLTAVSSHNGKVSNEIRLIFVAEETTGLPIYMRYVQGSIIDISTLVITVSELKKLSVCPDLALLDAGYYSEKNVDYLMENKVDFVCRVQPNRRTFKKMVSENRENLARRENLVRFENRLLYIKSAFTWLTENHQGWVYICLDLDRESIEREKLMNRKELSPMSMDDISDQLNTDGIFVMASSVELSTDEIMPVYYTRQQVEQSFDVSKNQADLLPLRIQSEEALRGHLLLAFISTVIYRRLHTILSDPKLKGMPKKGKVLTPEFLIQNLGYQHAKVYSDEIIPQEANSKANLGYKLFGLKSPLSISLDSTSEK